MSDHELRAVLWDMDGTLIDSEPFWIEAERRMLQRFGIPLTPGMTRFLIGSGLWEAAAHFRELGVKMSTDAIVAEWVEHVASAMDREPLRWRPGALALLTDLAASGVPCALVTMSVRSLAERLIAAAPPGCFGAVIAGDEVAHAKPDPEPYLRGASALGVAIDDCLAFEDSVPGLRSAFASGAVAIGVTNMVDLHGAPAHAVWRTLEGRDAAALRASFAELR